MNLWKLAHWSESDKPYLKVTYIKCGANRASYLDYIYNDMYIGIEYRIGNVLDFK